MRRTTVSSVVGKNIIAKDPLKDKDQKIQKLITLMKNMGFKAKQKSRKPALQNYGLLQYTLTIFGELANVVVTRNSGALGSNSPVKILIYIPTYDGMCGDWKTYISGVNKINDFIQKAKKIDENFAE